MRYPIKTLFLYRAVEPLDVGLVVLLAHTAMPVTNLFFEQSVREAGGELTAVVCLNHREYERRSFLRASRERSASMRTNAFHDFCICPPRIQINDGIHIYSRGIRGDDMDGIELKEGSTEGRFWSWGEIVWPLPRTALLSEMTPIKRPLHGRERDVDSVLVKCMVHMFSASPPSDPLLDDRDHDCP